MAVEMRSERLEVFVGDIKNPSLHLISTVGKVQEALECIMSPPPAPRPTIIPAVKVEQESIEIRKIRLEYRQKRVDAHHEYEKKIVELSFEEEQAIEAVKEA